MVIQACLVIVGLMVGPVSVATLEHQGSRELLVLWVQLAQLVTQVRRPSEVNKACRVHRDCKDQLE